MTVLSMMKAGAVVAEQHRQRRRRCDNGEAATRPRGNFPDRNWHPAPTPSRSRERGREIDDADGRSAGRPYRAHGQKMHDDQNEADAAGQQKCFGSPGNPARQHGNGETCRRDRQRGQQ